MLWQRIGHSLSEGGTSHILFNNVLMNAGVTWTPVTFNATQYLKGVSSDHSISVLALPQGVVCSDHCNSDHYVYHLAGEHVKELWLVRDHWYKTTQTIQSPMTWLNEVTN